MVILFHSSVERDLEVIMAYLLEKRGFVLLVLKGKEYDNGHLSPFFSRELWRWPTPSSSREGDVCPSSPKVMAYLQEKEEVCSSYS